MLSNARTKILRFILMFVAVVLIVNSMCPELSTTSRAMTGALMVSAFMIIDMYIPYVVIDDPYESKGQQ